MEINTNKSLYYTEKKDFAKNLLDIDDDLRFHLNNKLEDLKDADKREKKYRNFYQLDDSINWRLQENQCEQCAKYKKQQREYYEWNYQKEYHKAIKSKTQFKEPAPFQYEPKKTGNCQQCQKMIRVYEDIELELIDKTENKRLGHFTLEKQHSKSQDKFDKQARLEELHSENPYYIKKKERNQRGKNWSKRTDNKNKVQSIDEESKVEQDQIEDVFINPNVKTNIKKYPYHMNKAFDIFKQNEKQYEKIEGLDIQKEYEVVKQKNLQENHLLHGDKPLKNHAEIKRKVNYRDSWKTAMNTRMQNYEKKFYNQNAKQDIVLTKNGFYDNDND
eukprot:403345680